MLAPLALVANLVYLAAVAIILEYLVTHLNSPKDLPAVGNLSDLPLFFGTVIFAFEGVAVVSLKFAPKWFFDTNPFLLKVLPIENQMDQPHHFISPSGVLNTACMLVLCIYCTVSPLRLPPQITVTFAFLLIRLDSTAIWPSGTM